MSTAELAQRIRNAATEPTEELPTLLTVADVQKVVGCCRNTVKNMERRGDLIPVRIGGLKRFKLSDLQKLING